MTIKKRKVVYSQMVSLDGYIAGPNQEIDWSVPGEGLFQHFNDQESNIDIHLYGRKTYENMAGFWATAAENPNSTKNEIAFSKIWKKTTKIVFSKTLDNVDWNARLVRDNIDLEIKKLKAQAGKDMTLGGANLASTFMKMNLIDEYHLYIHPIVLGGGRSLFPPLENKLDMKLVESITFDSKVVLLQYQKTN